MNCCKVIQKELVACSELLFYMLKVDLAPEQNRYASGLLWSLGLGT